MKKQKPSMPLPSTRPLAKRVVSTLERVGSNEAPLLSPANTSEQGLGSPNQGYGLPVLLSTAFYYGAEGRGLAESQGLACLAVRCHGSSLALQVARKKP